MKKAVYFFCDDPFDPVAGNVLREAVSLVSPPETELIVDGKPVLEFTDDSGNRFSFVRTKKVVSHDYGTYLPVMNGPFADCHIAGIITWHEGVNAPDGILTVHTTGDVESGVFGAADPVLMRNILKGIEEARQEEGLDGYSTVTEATHWSGMVYGGQTADMIAKYPVPVLDIEIGSSPQRWADRRAARALARGLLRIFTDDGAETKNLLCAGGVHFDPNFAAAALTSWQGGAFAVSHILPNQWLVSGAYDGETGPVRLEECAASIRGGVHCVAFHDNLKGPLKDRFRDLAARLGVPAVKHQVLRTPEKIRGL